MQSILDFIPIFLGALQDLSIFFFSPLGALPSFVASRLGASDSSFVGSAIESVITGLLNIFPALSGLSFAAFLLGSGLFFLLLWRLVKFLVGIFS